jgi:putative membrane-bound dehydrogenase-like protein
MPAFPARVPRDFPGARLTCAGLGLLALAAGRWLPAQRTWTLHEFEKQQLASEFFCEGASFGDVNGDGKGDVIAGPYWYAGPDYKQRHEIYAPKPFDPAVYSDNFFAFPYDFDGDSALDVLFVGFPGQKATWYRNPGKGEGAWTAHVVFEVVDNESPAFLDLTGDGKPELVCQHGDRLGYAEPDWQEPGKPWTFRAVTPPGRGGRFTHGLGAGDVDGDGRLDLLARVGWWRQPQTLGGNWQHEPFPFGERGGAQMYAYDVDGDGDGDVITSLNAHGHGLAWFEQVVQDGKRTFVPHRIMGSVPAENEYGLVIGNLHALALADMNGDGLLDLVTGNRWWAHGGRDQADREPALLYWFELVREATGARYLVHEIDGDSGVGTQLVVGDVDGDTLPDVVVGNKKGTFLHRHRARNVSRAAFLDAQRQQITKLRASGKIVDRSGLLPAGADGKALNLDLETGDLRDWTATGEAFAKMPVESDTVHPRRDDMHSRHQGRYWIGTYERNGDGPRGTLTSAAFPVTHPFASFLVGGGSSPDTRVELVEVASKKVVFAASGRDREDLAPRFVDLRALRDKQLQIRLVDDHSGHWGHVNFDDFRFHAESPDVAAAALADARGASPLGMAPKESAARMTVPQGFHVDLIAGEPDLHQPVGFCLDERGRIWVAEAHSYPVRQPDGQGKDNILVFEDKDADGSYETRTVFCSGLNLVSGLEVGFGGVWIGAAPHLLFIPDRDQDLKPDSEPQVLLDGWGYQDTHETLNGFLWGPDGWLYGCHGVFTHSKVGKPGTREDQRAPINAGIWRYHPTRHEFEVFAWGTSNPWGVDFDDHGQAFATACVIPHLFHVIQGARYQRQAGQHFGRFVFDDIETIADHVHYLGADPHGGNDVSETVGGGHAHCGAMVYLGDGFPESYRNAVFMSNIHGNRINMDVPRRLGSGFTASHGADLLLANDPWFRGINLKYGPDGSVFLIDWYDKQACHLSRTEAWDRSNGRLYRIRYGDLVPKRVDLSALAPAKLVALQTHKNDWYVRTARRLLQEKPPTAEVRTALKAMVTGEPTTPRRLRALWAQHCTGGIDAQAQSKLLAHEDEHLRAWTIQLALEDRVLEPELQARFERMAAEDPSPVVRLYLASALQRLPVERRWAIAAALAAHAEDAQDHNLPLMLWYGFEPLVAADPARALELATQSKVPSLLPFAVRRCALGGDVPLEPLLALLARSEPPRQALVLDEMRAGFARRGEIKMPAGWPEVFARLRADASLRDRATWVAVAFGDVAAAPYLREVATDQKLGRQRRAEALQGLLRLNDRETLALLRALVGDPELAVQAISGLAKFDDPATAPLLLERWAALDAKARDAAVATLTGRAAWAKELLRAIVAGKVDKSLLDSAPTRRQLALLQDAEVTELVGAAWGRLVATSADKRAEIDRIKKQLDQKTLARADLHRGRAVYERTCAACHKLFGAGQSIGPDLTGSNRADLEYVLGNVLDPNAEVGKQYMLASVRMQDGRVLTGMIADENEQTLTVRNDTVNETVRVADIQTNGGKPEVTRLSLSLMPEGLLQSMSEADVRDLVAYLAGKAQVPLRATPEHASRLFDGKTLAGWRANPDVWRIEDGEIVGRTTTGLAHNDFAQSELLLADFRLVVDVKLVGNQGNSGIQFRSRAHGERGMQGPQADIGPGWWGKLYDEEGRGTLWDRSGEPAVRIGEWNTYEIECTGSKVRTSINGTACVELEDKKLPREGVLGLQVHSGGPTEVRFRNFRLEVLAR